MDTFFSGPSGLGDPAGPDIVSLPVNWMMTACMAPGFNRASGWMGLALCPGDATSWTCRLRSRHGIYGLTPANLRSDGDRRCVDFTVFFFPDPDDDLLDSCSLAAAVLAASPDARARMRDFASHPEFAAPFAVGTLSTSVDASAREIHLALSADERRRLIAADGVAAPGGGWVIEPGGTDEDLPALDVAADLLRVLASGLSLNLDRAPTFLASARPAHETVYHADGSAQDRPAAGLRHVTHVLSWGDPDHARTLFPELSRSPAPEEASARFYRESPSDIDTDLADANGPRPSLVVLSGFLGSGKTSFLNQFIEFHTSRGQFVTVIQNEIGEVGVDGKLLEGDESVVELDAGCVCCTLAGSLSVGVRRLIERFQPEVIVLETTGLANPLNLVNEMHDLEHLVRLESVVTLVDASRFEATLENASVAGDQVAGADVLVLNKCDLVAPDALESIRKRLRAMNPDAQILETTHGRINPGLLPTMSRHGTGEPDTAAHEHPSHSHDGYSFWRLPLARGIDPAAIGDRLAGCPGGIDRVKGIVDTRDDGLMALQYVPGSCEFVPVTKGDAADPFLVIIGRHLDEDALARHWQSVTRETS